MSQHSRWYSLHFGGASIPDDPFFIPDDPFFIPEEQALFMRSQLFRRKCWLLFIAWGRSPLQKVFFLGERGTEQIVVFLQEIIEPLAQQ